MIVGMSQSLLPKNTRSKRPLKLRSRPTPAVIAGCAKSYIQIKDPNDDTVSVLADEDFSDQEEQNISYETRDYTQHIFYHEPFEEGVYAP